jgi:hypothetical protein
MITAECIDNCKAVLEACYLSIRDQFAFMLQDRGVSGGSRYFSSDFQSAPSGDWCKD